MLRTSVASWLFVGGVVFFGISNAWAQPEDAEAEPERPSLSSRVGAARAAALLEEGDPAARLRAIERLGSSDAEEAVVALAEAMAPGTAARSDPRSRLAALRHLARHAGDEEKARQVLLGVLNSVRAGAPEEPLDALSRQIAAMGLARADTEESLSPLVTAVIGGGRTGSIARSALLACRPKNLVAVVKSFDELSPRTIEVLGQLGDPRAIGVLRHQLKRDDRKVERAVLVALARLGDGSIVDRAEAFLDRPDEPGGKKQAKEGAKQTEGGSSPAEQIAAAEALTLLDAPRAPEAIAELLGRVETRNEALRLAEESLSPALLPTLRAVLAAKVTDAERLRTALIVAQMGDLGTPILLELLNRPALATVAALGLARARGPLAEDGLTRALRDAPAGAPKRLILRAGIVRKLVVGEVLDGLVAALEEAYASADPSDRAIGAFGLGVLGRLDVDALVADEDPVRRGEAHRVALATGRAAALGPRFMELARAGDEATLAREGLSLALLVQGDRSIEALASSTLATWAEAGGALAPAAALRLATRDSRAFRARLRQLLDGTSPSLRAQVALGLGASPEADATYLLVERFRFEPEAIVRAAIVRGLSQRPEKLRLPTLRQAALLDPDERVRALATSALAGRKLAAPLFARGPAEVAWVTLRANSEGEREAVVRRPVEVRRADGLVVPMVSAPDGVVLVVGLREGERYDLAIVPQAPPKAPVVAPAAPPKAPPAATPEAETEPLAPAPLPDEAQPDGG